jgi:hypothetical protein
MYDVIEEPVEVIADMFIKPTYKPLHNIIKVVGCLGFEHDFYLRLPLGCDCYHLPIKLKKPSRVRIKYAYKREDEFTLDEVLRMIE